MLKLKDVNYNEYIKARKENSEKYRLAFRYFYGTAGKLNVREGYIDDDGRFVPFDTTNYYPSSTESTRWDVVTLLDQRDDESAIKSLKNKADEYINKKGGLHKCSATFRNKYQSLDKEIIVKVTSAIEDKFSAVSSSTTILNEGIKSEQKTDSSINEDLLFGSLAFIIAEALDTFIHAYQQAKTENKEEEAE